MPVKVPVTKLNYKSLPQIMNFLVGGDEKIESVRLYFINANPKYFTKYTPKFSHILAYIYKALDYEDKLDIKVENIPFCLLKNAEDHVINKPSQFKVKPAKCLKCKYNQKCGGIWKNYAKKIGFKEIKPVRDIAEEVIIEVTARCNLNCSFCFNKNAFARKNRKVKELSTKEIKRIINKIHAEGIPAVRFSGGEPLLREDIFTLLQYAKSKKLHVRLNTNGTLVNKEISKKLESCVDNVLIPLNSCCSSEDSKISGLKHSFEKRINALRLLKKTKIKIVRSGTIATRDNINHLEKIFEIVKGLNLDDWEIYRPVQTSKDEDLMTKKDVKLLVDKLTKIKQLSKRVYPIANALPFCAHEPRKVRAVSLGAKYDDGHARLVVDARGYVKPSYFIDKNIGSPFDIMSCWDSRFMRDMRNLKFVPNICKKCDYLEQCKGGSRFAAKLVNGSYNKEDPLSKFE